MDLQKLHENGVISKDTMDWLLPLWQQELEDIERLREARTANLFSFTNDEDDSTDCHDQYDHSMLMITKDTIQNLEGITFSFCMDVASTAHGNHVWHASIAMCTYLKKHHLPKVLGATGSRCGLMFHRSLELGAGTALPSLFWGHLLASQLESPLSHERPFVHITDGKQYRNLRQILLSLSEQPANIVENMLLRVSPHNWGEGLEDETWREDSNGCLIQACEGPTKTDNNCNSYDLVLVSDCIYNPLFHGDLLKTIAATLRLPPATTDESGGKAILSFSLHGNTPDQHIWNFIDHLVPQTRHGNWQLTAQPVLAHWEHTNNRPQPVEGRYGWDMENTMMNLGLWTSHIEPKRWFSYLYEITWRNAKDIH
jgi:hypothetical protein